MMNRKTVTNQDRIMFKESKIVAPPGNGVFSQQPSAQARLFPKAETKKTFFNYPIPSPGSSPAVRRMRPLGHCNIKTDPSMEDVVAKLDNFNTVSLSDNLPQVAPKSFCKGNPISWKPTAMFKPSSPLTPPFSPNEELLKMKKDHVDSCICMRPLKRILCSACSYTITGRLRKICQVHPKAVYLLDIDACPSCKEAQSVLKEHELPNGSDQRSHDKDRNDEYKEKVVTIKGKRARSDDDVGSQNKRTRRDGSRFSR